MAKKKDDKSSEVVKYCKCNRCQWNYPCHCVLPEETISCRQPCPDCKKTIKEFREKGLAVPDYSLYGLLRNVEERQKEYETSTGKEEKLKGKNKPKKGKKKKAKK